MKNFRVSVKPNNEQLYINNILLNNLSLENESFSFIKKELIFNESLFDGLMKIIKKTGVRLEDEIPLLSLSNEDSIKIILCDSRRFRNIIEYINDLNDLQDFNFLNDLKDYYSTQEISDYSIIDIYRLNTLDNDIEFSEIPGVYKVYYPTIKFTNLYGDFIEFESQNGIKSYEWNLITEKIKINLKEWSKEYERREEEEDEYQSKRDEIEFELGEEAESLKMHGDYQGLSNLIDEKIASIEFDDFMEEEERNSIEYPTNYLEDDDDDDY